MNTTEVEEIMHQADCFPEEFFRRAMKWKYQVPHDTRLDYLRYTAYGTIPAYVVEYCIYLKAIRAKDDSTCDDVYPSFLGRGD